MTKEMLCAEEITYIVSNMTNLQQLNKLNALARYYYAQQQGGSQVACKNDDDNLKVDFIYPKDYNIR